MNKKLQMALLVSVGMLAGCGTGDGFRQTSVLPPNCQTITGSCQVTVTVTMSGSTPVFSIDPYQAIPPSNTGQPITIAWFLPTGYMFFAGDGVYFSNPGSDFSNFGFGDNVASATRPPDARYHWVLAQNAKVNAPYVVLFHAAVTSGINPVPVPGQRWLCDPTIFNFDSPLAHTKTRVGASQAVCYAIPG
ncbi:MAG: hypothetical protein ABI781_19800 [Burkholderiales bacterium]